MPVCICSHAKTSMPRVCVSLSQIVSHSVSSCVCVSAVAERTGEEMEESVWEGGKEAGMVG